MYWGPNYSPQDEGDQWRSVLPLPHFQMGCYWSLHHVLLPDVASPPSSTGSNELSCRHTSSMCQGMPLITTDCGLVIPVTWPVTNFDMQCPCWFFTQTASSLYQANNINSFYSNSEWMQQIGSIEETNTSSLDKILYQYMASIIGQLFHIAICFTVQWHLSIISFLDGL